MKKRCFRVTGEGGLVEVAEAAALDAGDEGCAWIDVHDFSATDLTGWLRSLGFSEETVRASSGISGRTRVQLSGAEVFFEFPALASVTGIERTALAFLCRPGMCITLHPTSAEGLHETVNQVVQSSGRPPGSLSALVATLLASLSVRAVDAVDDLRARVLDQQEQMDRDPGGVEADVIQRESSAIRTLDGIIGERVVVFDRLRALEAPTLQLADLRDFRVALADAQYMERAVDRLEKRVADLRVRFSAAQQDRTNRRLAVLTVLSAVFLPLTLLAGIYGMNFEFMPELGYLYAYPLALGAMLVIAIGMIAYFRSRGWFD